MTRKPLSKLVTPLLILGYVFLGALLFRYVAKYVLSWIAPFLGGFLVSRLALPLCRRWKGKKLYRLTQILATILILLLAFAVITGFIFAVYHFILPYFEDLKENLSRGTEQLEESLRKLGSFLEPISPDLSVKLTEKLEDLPGELNLVSWFGGPLWNAATSVPTYLFTAVAFFVSAFFFLFYNGETVAFFRRAFPGQWYDRLARVYRHLFQSLFRWVRAQCVLCSICFVELSVGMLILGVRSPVVTALLIAVVDFLPVLGVGTVLIPWALIALCLGNFPMAIGVAILYVVILVVRNTVEPYVLSQQIGMHPLVTLITIYLGFRMFGFIGMFVLPLAALTVIRLNEWGYIRLWPVEKTEELRKKE